MALGLLEAESLRFKAPRRRFLPAAESPPAALQPRPPEGAKSPLSEPFERLGAKFEIRRSPSSLHRLFKPF